MHENVFSTSWDSLFQRGWRQYCLNELCFGSGGIVSCDLSEWEGAWQELTHPIMVLTGSMSLMSACPVKPATHAQMQQITATSVVASHHSFEQRFRPQLHIYSSFHTEERGTINQTW